MTLSVFDAAREAPDRAALIVGGVVIDYRELAERVARRLSALGPLIGDRPGTVALVGASDLPTLETVFGLMATGRPMLLLHPRFTEPERAAAIELLEPEYVLRSEDMSRDPRNEITGQRPAPVDDGERLAVLMTSGTTGRPKGVVLSRRAFLASARASAHNIALSSGDRWLLGLPIAHIGGLSVLTRCLIARAAVVVPDEIAAGRRLDAPALMRTMERDQVSLASLVPTQLEWLASGEPPWSPPPHLRAILLGGAAARSSLLARAVDRGFPVLTTYGMTETCSQVTTQLFGTTNRGELGSGPPLDGFEVRIAGGTIEVRGPALFDGYLPASAGVPLDAEGWFTTGDLGRLNADGNLHVVGRASELVITGGENVHPAEVESVLERCPGVAGACVFGVPDATWGELLAVAIVPAPAGPPSDEALAAFVRERLSSHRRPRLVADLDAFATHPSGKPDRNATRDLAVPRLRRL